MSSSWRARALAKATLAAYLCIILCCCMQMSSVRAAIYARQALLSAGNSNTIDDDDEDPTASGSEASATRSTSSATATASADFADKMSWQCANNASCLYALANGIISSYKRGDTVKLGFLDLVRLQQAPPIGSVKKLNDSETGRGISTFVDFISGNAIRIPVGPMVFSVQRAEDDGNYIEIALLKKADNQGRGGGGGGSGGSRGGMLGGGGGGGGGILGGGGGGRHRKKGDKKQFQMYIPMYLAATTFGWTMVAAKAVGLLTLKALAVSKLAFIVAAMVIIKKIMDNASEKMMYQFPEHTPYVMPYGMDYGMHPEMAGGGEMYPAPMHIAGAAPMQHQGGGGGGGGSDGGGIGGGHPGLETLVAESSMHHNIADLQNNTQMLAALNAVNLGQKVKREDSWIAKSSAAMRRPLVYNYIQPHPYYRV